MAKSTYWASEENKEIVSRHSKSIWCSLLHYLLCVDGAKGMLRDLESLLTGSQMNGYLLLAEVFVSGKFVWNSFESRFSFGSWDLQYVLFYSWKCLKHEPAPDTKFCFAFCLIWSFTFKAHSLSTAACISIASLVHYPHPYLQGRAITLPILQRGWGTCPGPPRSLWLGAGWTQPPTSLWFYPFSPFPPKGADVKRRKIV